MPHLSLTDLEEGELFTLPCEGNRTIYRMGKIVCVGGKDTGPVDHGLIYAMAGWWPANSQGIEHPGKWEWNKEPQQSRCNPYAAVRRLSLSIPGPDGMKDEA